MEKTELVQAIKNGRLAEYVSNNYWQMDRVDLKDIIIQLFFTMWDNDLVEEDIGLEEILERLDLE